MNYSFKAEVCGAIGAIKPKILSYLLKRLNKTAIVICLYITHDIK